MVFEVTKGVKVSVYVEYQPYYSAPRQFSYVFSYKIRIDNFSDNTVQLLNRHWHIIDANGFKREIQGEGVIGEQPVIEPGDFHEYVSGCRLDTAMGKMYGTFEMEKVMDGGRFLVAIPEFHLLTAFSQN